MRFKEGDVLLFGGDSLFGKIISKLTNSKWNHVGIIQEVNKETKCYLVAESVERGFVNLRKNGELNYYTEEYILNRIKEKTMLVRRAKKKLSNVNDIIVKYLKTRYSWIGIWNDFMWIKFHRTSIFYKKGEKEMVCSEAVVRCLYDMSSKKINFEEEFLKDFDIIFPSDISISTQMEDINVNE